MLQIHALTHAQLATAARQAMETGHGRARKIYQQALLEGRFAPEEHGLNATSVDAWRQHFALSLPRVHHVALETSDDGRTTVLRQNDVSGLQQGSYVRVDNGRAIRIR